MSHRFSDEHSQTLNGFAVILIAGLVIAFIWWAGNTFFTSFGPPSGPLTLSAPVVRITDTKKFDGQSMCAGRNFQLANGSLVTLSICGHPWITAVQVGDRLKQEKKFAGIYMGFAK